MESRSVESGWIRAVVCTGVLLLAAVVPSPLERRSEWERVGPDKFLHFVGHGGYTVLVAEAADDRCQTNWTAGVVAVCLSTAVSLVSGYLKGYVPGRAFERADVVAGLLGSLLAASGWYVVTSTGCASRDDRRR